MYAFYRKRLNVLDVLAPAPLDIKLHEGAVLELDADAFDLVVDASRHVLVQMHADVSASSCASASCCSCSTM